MTSMAKSTSANETLDALRALASPKRLQILEWLPAPIENFPPQRDGDLVETAFASSSLLTSSASPSRLRLRISKRWLALVSLRPRRSASGPSDKRGETAIRAFKRQLRDDL
jgi:hypothetical protein